MNDVVYIDHMRIADVPILDMQMSKVPIISGYDIVGSLVVLERGVKVRRNCNIFNLAMENVLKGLPDKISCPDIIHKCTSNVHIFLITFKLRDRGIGFLYT
jgi:hypothetical protein